MKRFLILMFVCFMIIGQSSISYANPIAKGVVTASAVNVRMLPEIEEGNIIGVLYKGTEVSILGYSSDHEWCSVSEIGGQTEGWVYAEYIDIITNPE